jgi:hypothetical protein
MTDAEREAQIRAWEELHRGEQVGDIPELTFVLRLLDEARAQSGWQPIETGPPSEVGEVLFYFPEIKNDIRGHGGLVAMYRVGRLINFPFRPPTHWKLL